MRIPWLAVGILAFLGCTLPGGPFSVPENPPPRPASNAAAASVSLPEVGAEEPDTLTLAAECLERGDCAKSTSHLEAYVCRHPEQLLFRAQLAEMLIRAGRDAAAKVHYERFLAEAQATTGRLREHLVAAHTRLMEIAQRSDDRFAELFHRGAGLLLLVKQHARSADADQGFNEEMLCQAIKALAEAKKLNPNDARTRVCLAEAYERSGNWRAADAEHAGARLATTPGQLTIGERQKCLLLNNSLAK